MDDAQVDDCRRGSDHVGGPAPGAVLGDRYRVERVLGVGGMGIVLEARDLEAAEPVAVKVMRARGDDGASAGRRFLREVRAARSLQSDHVAQVLDAGELGDGRPFMVMELLSGEPLDRVVDHDGPLPIGEAVDFVLQACEGVAHAHAQGIVHRDLKPANLFRTRRQDGSWCIKVLDFGVAKALLPSEDTTSGGSLTGTNALLGSPEYMAPEQIRSAKQVDARADIWALGLCLHRLLTARRAFDGDDFAERLTQIMAASPLAPREVRPELDGDLEQVVLKCLRKDPDRRYRSVADLAQALQPHGPSDADERVTRISELLEHSEAAARIAPQVEIDETPTLDGVSDGAALASKLLPVAGVEEAETLEWAPEKRAAAPKRAVSRPAVRAVAILAIAAALGGLLWVVLRLPGTAAPTSGRAERSFTNRGQNVDRAGTAEATVRAVASAVASGSNRSELGAAGASAGRPKAGARRGPPRAGRGSRAGAASAPAATAPTSSTGQFKGPMEPTL